MDDMDELDMMMGNCSCNMSMHGMKMQFYFGFLPDGLLFTSWTINSAGDLIGSIIAILILAILYEGLKSLREFLMTLDQQMRKKKLSQSIQNEKTPLLPNAQQPTWVDSLKAVVREYVNIFHIVQSILHVVQVGLGYMLMLIAMSYNGWLFLAVCFGAGIGYFIFAACRRQSPSTQTFREKNEHCE